MSGPTKPTNDKAINRQLIINGIVEYVSLLPGNRKITTRSEMEGLLQKLMSTHIAKDQQIVFPKNGDMDKLVTVLNDYIKIGMEYNEKQNVVIIPSIFKALEDKGLTYSDEPKHPRP